jgi:hypothetical protein
MNNQRLVILLLLVAYIFSPSLFDWIINTEGTLYRVGSGDRDRVHHPDPPQEISRF